MLIPHNTSVAVCDGATFLLFRNNGDAQAIDLRVQSHDREPDPASRDINTDGPGSTGSGAERSAVDGGDAHQHNEDVFGRTVAERLHRLVEAKAVTALVLIAAPRTLGVMRKHLHKSVQAVMLGELHKDLTNMDATAIARALQAA